MIIRVLDEERSHVCDMLLTKLIQDERQYDNSIDENFIVKNYFQNVIKNENNILLCYEEDEIIKGYIYLKPIDIDNKKGYLIDGLYVDTEYRNNGIATKLIEKALTIVENIDFIDINVMANNNIAINLYKHFGFKEFRISLRKNI